MKKIAFCLLFYGFHYCCLSQSVTADSVNRSVFLFEKFLAGEAHFKDGSKQQSLFNYNILFQQLIFQQAGNMAALANNNTIDTLYIDSRKFVAADTSFYEIRLENSRLPLYIRHSCHVSQAAPSTPYGSSSQTGSVQKVSSYRLGVATPYQLAVPDNYVVDRKDEFFIRQAGQLIQLKTGKHFKKIFPGKENEIKDFIRENDISFSKQTDVEQLVIFCGQYSNLKK